MNQQEEKKRMCPDCGLGEIEREPQVINGVWREIWTCTRRCGWMLIK